MRSDDDSFRDPSASTYDKVYGTGFGSRLNSDLMRWGMGDTSRPGTDCIPLPTFQRNNYLQHVICGSIVPVACVDIVSNAMQLATFYSELYFPGGGRDGASGNALLHITLASILTIAFNAVLGNPNPAEFYLYLHEFVGPNTDPVMNQVDSAKNYYGVRMGLENLNFVPYNGWADGDEVWMERVGAAISRKALVSVMAGKACTASLLASGDTMLDDERRCGL